MDEGLRVFGTLAPVPFLKDAANAAVHVAHIAKSVLFNEEEFRCIARDAHIFVDEINQTCLGLQQAKGKVAGALILHLKEFVDTLTKIRAFAEANTRRRMFTKFLFKEYDPGNIRRCREDLQACFNTFVRHSSTQLRAELAAALQSNVARMSGVLADERPQRGRRHSLGGAAKERTTPVLFQSPIDPEPDAIPRPPSAPPESQEPLSHSSSLPNHTIPVTKDDYFALPKRPVPTPSQSHPILNVNTSPNLQSGDCSKIYDSGNLKNTFEVGRTSTTTSTIFVTNYYYGAEDRPRPQDDQMGGRQSRKTARENGMKSWVRQQVMDDLDGSW